MQGKAIPLLSKTFQKQRCRTQAVTPMSLTKKIFFHIPSSDSSFSTSPKNF